MDGHVRGALKHLKKYAANLALRVEKHEPFRIVRAIPITPLSRKNLCRLQADGEYARKVLKRGYRNCPR